MIGGGNDWHAADEAGRKEIWEAHKQYTLEFYHFLTTDPAVPKSMRERYAKLGLCKDEFASHDHFSPALYVRESRRMKGQYVISQKDILETPEKEDPIAISSFPIDSHDCQRIALPGGGVINEGTIFPVRKTNPKQGYAYHVPYRSILPREEQCDNLLVPVALSCTHVGISSLRIEGAWMAIGQGAGVAAALAADADLPVQDLAYEKLRKRLIEQGQVSQLPEVPEPATQSESIDKNSLPGIVLDDSQAKRTGHWSRSTNFKPHIGTGYLYCGEKDSRAKGDGNTTATFDFRVPKSGRYQVLMAYSAHESRSKNVPLTISSGEEQVSFHVDQTIPMPSGKHFRSVGTVALSAETETIIRITNADTSGFVILDAVQLLPVETGAITER